VSIRSAVTPSGPVKSAIWMIAGTNACAASTHRKNSGMKARYRK